MSNNFNHNWAETHSDLFPITDWEMARKSGQRHCTACRRPCRGHPGRTGANCSIAAAADRMGVAPEALAHFPALPEARENTHVNRDHHTRSPSVKSPDINAHPPTPEPSSSVNVFVSRAPLNEPWPSHDWAGTPPRSFDETYVPLAGDLTPVSSAPPVSTGAYAPVTQTVQAISRPVPSALPQFPWGSQRSQSCNTPVFSSQSYFPASVHPPQSYTVTYTSAPCRNETSTLGGHQIPSPLWNSERAARPDVPHCSYNRPVISQPPAATPRPLERPSCSGCCCANSRPPVSFANVSHTTHMPPSGHYVPSSTAWPGSYNVAGGHPSGATSAPPATNSIHPGFQPPQSAPFFESQAPSVRREQPQPRVDNRCEQLDTGLEFLDRKNVDSAVNGEFVHLDEFLCNNSADVDELRSTIDEMGNVQVRSVRGKRGINSVLKWLEAWVNYEMIMCKRFGYTLYYEMARYRAFIINISQKFKFSYVYNYDVRHRQRLANARSCLFSSVDHDLYITIFDTGAVKSLAKCAKCSSVEHSTSQCDRVSGNGKGAGARGRGQARGRRGGGQ